MKIKELLSEAFVNPKIRKVLKSKGYKFLDRGQDQDVYLAPDGTILKIFGYEYYTPKRKQFTTSQQSFIDFANYCKKNSNNEFLPKFGGWTTFTFEGKQYLQIKCERLFPITGKYEGIADSLEIFVQDWLKRYGIKGVEKYIKKNIEKPSLGPDSPYTENDELLMVTFGKEGIIKFAEAVVDLNNIAKQKGYVLDLHGGNFMFSSEGEIVINDPFFTGSFRST